MEAPIEIRYAGVVIGQAQESHSIGEGNLSFFISVRDPMPVGSLLYLRSGDREAPARVLHVVESADKAGMSVHLLDEAEATAFEATPPPAVMAEREKPAAVPAETAPAEAAAEAAPAEAAAEAAPAEALVVQAVPAQAPPAEAAPGAAPSAAAQPPQAAPKEAAPITLPEVAAIPEAVPVAIGSSLTGALEKAAENGEAGEPSDAQALVEDAQAAAAEAGETPETDDGSPAFPEATPAGDEPPPARPIPNPTGRRRSKRRR